MLYFRISDSAPTYISYMKMAYLAQGPPIKTLNMFTFSYRVMVAFACI